MCVREDGGVQSTHRKLTGAQGECQVVLDTGVLGISAGVLEVHVEGWFGLGWETIYNFMGLR